MTPSSAGKSPAPLYTGSAQTSSAVKSRRPPRGDALTEKMHRDFGHAHNLGDTDPTMTATWQQTLAAV
jgi:hypothetical protein